MNYKELRKAKETYFVMYKIYETIESEGIVKSPIEGVSLTQLLRMDIAEFLMYLSASDGRIDSREVKVFQTITGFRDGAHEIVEHIKSNNIYSTDYETTVPSSMIVAVEAESIKASSYGQKRDITLPELLIDLYESIGSTLIQSDGDVTHNERRDYRIYLNTLEKYIREQEF